MRTLHLSACLVTLAWVGAALAAGEKTVLLNPLDSAEKLQATWEGPRQGARIEVNRDPRFISQGTGSVRLSVRSGANAAGRQYFGLMIPLAKTDCRRRTLLLDCWTSTPAAVQAVYVRLFSGRARAGGWSNWGKPFGDSGRLTIELFPETDIGDFVWEAKTSDPNLLDRVTAAEIIIGTTVPNARIDVYVDNLRIGAQPQVPFAEVPRPKRLYRETPLARGGRAEAILVVPPGEAPARAARRIQERIHTASGAELPIVRPEEATPERLSATQAVLLGNVCNNRAMLPLYALLYTTVDDDDPPGDGYLVHTVHDPWGTGRNAVIVGAASDAGLLRAADALLAALPTGRDVVLPKLNLFQLSPQEMKQAEADRSRLGPKAIAAELEQARKRFARGEHRSVASRMAEVGFRYGRTGADGLARLYRDLAVAWHESYLAKPAIYGGPWGMDMDFHLMEILPAWDLVEESPALTDEDRLRVTRILHEFVTTDVVRKAAYVLRSKHVRHNHITFPALGLFYAGNYFQKAYASPEADRWLAIARACFRFQAQTTKPYEDCNGYGWLVPYHTMRYSLATLDPAYFTSGNVARLADYGILTMDNLGYQVPYGDTGSYQCWWSEIPFLRGAAFSLRDGRYAWAIQKKLAVRPDASRSQYATRIEPREPSDLLGARAWPLARPYWESFDGPSQMPLEKTFDKLVMRSSFDPDRQYLLLDGLSNGGHMHYDGNSISRITDRGRIWLADNDYIRSLPKFHNSLLVFRDGHTETIPPYCELDLLCDAREHAASRTSVRAYAGADWRRTILWSKEQFFLVFDELAARQAGDYDFHCMWHGVGRPRLTDEGLELEQKGPQSEKGLQLKQRGPRFWIKHAAGPSLGLSDDAELGRNWTGYAYAEPVVRSLRQVQSARLQQGQQTRFVNLLYATDEQRPQDYSIAPAAAGTVLLRSGPTRLLAGVGPCSPAPGLSIAAEAFLLGRDSGFVAGAKRLAWGNFSLESSAPLSVEWSGRCLTLQASQPADVRMTGWRGRLEPGQREVQLPEGALGALGAALDAIRPVLPPKPAQSAVASAVPARWQFRPAEKSEKITATAAADLDGDGQDEILAGSDQGRIWCLASDGRVLWQHRAGGKVTTAAAARLDRSDRRYALFGSEDCKVYALSSTGVLKWSYELPQYKQAGRVRVLLAADLDGDGLDRVIAGGDNWRYYVLDVDGRELWHYESVHPSSAAAAADLDGDGRRELLCGTVYYWWHCVDANGSKRWSYSVKGPHATVALAVNFTGTKTRSAVFGSEDGNLHVLDPKGRLQWTANVGDHVTGAVAADLAGDGREQLVASSMSFSLFALDGSGKVRWRTNVGSPVLSLAAAGGRLLAGCQDGSLVVLDAQGKPSARFLAGSPVLAVVPARSGPGKTQIVLRLDDGRIEARGL